MLTPDEIKGITEEHSRMKKDKDYFDWAYDHGAALLSHISEIEGKMERATTFLKKSIEGEEYQKPCKIECFLTKSCLKCIIDKTISFLSQ